MSKPHQLCEREFLTKKELARRLRAESTRLVDEMVAAGKIPVVRLGHRTVRFEWGDVCQALEKLTVWPTTGTKKGEGQ